LISEGSLLHFLCICSHFERVEQFRKIRLLKEAVIGLLLFQFGLMIAMASSSEVHETLHCHSEHAEHHCEVTLFQNGALGDGMDPSPDLGAPVRWEAPEAFASCQEAEVTATHLIGGALAQGPARAP
jgi:hypothetical protein